MNRADLETLARRADALHGEAIGDKRLAAISGGKVEGDAIARLKETLGQIADEADVLIDCGISPHDVERRSRGWLKFDENWGAVCVPETNLNL